MWVEWTYDEFTWVVPTTQTGQLGVVDKHNVVEEFQLVAGLGIRILGECTNGQNLGPTDSIDVIGVEVDKCISSLQAMGTPCRDRHSLKNR